MAVTVTASDIKTLFPEFQALDPTVIDLWVAEALPEVNETQWSSKATAAVKFLTAHLLTVFAGTDGAGTGSTSDPGPVSSEREGQVQASYAVSSAFTSDDLGTTKYGRRYLSMRSRIFVTRKI